jgi:hypothetical protein
MSEKNEKSVSQEINKVSKEYLSNLGKKELIIMTFLYKSLENGWTIRKSKDIFLFKKKHNGQREILDPNYLSKFMDEHLDIEEVDKWIKYLGSQ